jgi:heterodisulfide reductase subunit A-like polyferredoxin
MIYGFIQPTRPNKEPMKTFAVVGAGPAGLAAMKELKEAGFEVTAFDRSVSIGGRWSCPSRRTEAYGRSSASTRIVNCCPFQTLHGKNRIIKVTKRRTVVSFRTAPK